MACTEHVRSVDPRYLDRPEYDFEYTVSARRGLEARLKAAEHLGIPPNPSWVAGVQRAYALLEPRLRVPGTDPPPTPRHHGPSQEDGF